MPKSRKAKFGREDTQQEKVDSFTTTGPVRQNDVKAMDWDESTRIPSVRQEVRFNTTPKHSKHKSHTSTISEALVPDHKLAASFRIVHRRRERILGRRVDIVNQRIEHEYQRNAILTSTAQVSNAAEALLARSDLAASFSPEFLALQQAVQESKEFARKLEDLEKKFQRATKTLNQKESELYEKETKVYKRLVQITGFTSPPPLASPVPVQSARSASSVSTTQTHPRARRYYDAAGEAKILREKIHNLQVQHRHEQHQRESGHIGNLSERRFRERFEGRLSALLQQLERCKKDAFLLKLACQRQGISLEDDGESQNNQNIVDTPFDDDRRILSAFAGHQNGRSKSLVMADILSGYMDTTTKIRRWLNAMPQDSEDMEAALPDSFQNHLGSEGDSLLPAASPTTSLTTPSRADLPIPVHMRVTVEFLADESKRATAFKDLDHMDNTSYVSNAALTFSDGEFSQPEWLDGERTRRYSEPSPVRSSWLQPDDFRMLSYPERRSDIRLAPCYSH
jgi:hypothetical protein